MCAGQKSGEHVALAETSNYSAFQCEGKKKKKKHHERVKTLAVF